MSTLAGSATYAPYLIELSNQASVDRLSAASGCTAARSSTGGDCGCDTIPLRPFVSLPFSTAVAHGRHPFSVMLSTATSDTERLTGRT